MASYLSVVEGAFRATLEEQDDAALWFTAAVRNSGSDCNLLLQKNAVHYALLNQQRPRLEIGDMVVENPPEFDEDLLRVIEKGGKVFVNKDDLADLGLGDAPLIAGVTTFGRDELAKITADFDQVWWW
jgi:hypothetical protein